MTDYREINKDADDDTTCSGIDYIKAKRKAKDLDSLIKELQEDLMDANVKGNQVVAFEISRDLCRVVSYKFMIKNNAFYGK